MRSTTMRDDRSSTAQLLVLWQEPRSRSMQPVAVLSFNGIDYAFRYLESASSIDGFRPLLGFKDLDQEYVSSTLFPLFKERALDPSRPDFERYIESIDLDLEAASPWEILVRSGGKSEGDTLQLTPFPVDLDDEWKFRFMVAGVRYLQDKFVTVEGKQIGNYPADVYERILSGISPGDLLFPCAEEGNSYQPNAVVLRTSKGDAVGYLPDWLARVVSEYQIDLSSLRITVEHSNGPTAGWHLRLLVRMDVAATSGLNAGGIMRLLDQP